MPALTLGLELCVITERLRLEGTSRDYVVQPHAQAASPRAC